MRQRPRLQPPLPGDQMLDVMLKIQAYIEATLAWIEEAMQEIESKLEEDR